MQERYRAPGTERQTNIVAGRRMVNYYNCVGCHIIENRGGFIRRFYPEDQINFAPPILNGEGAKVQPQWLFNFLQGPTPIRPWLKIRMPTFQFTSTEDDTVVNYFGAMADLQVPYMFLNTNLVPVDLSAGGPEADVERLLQLLLIAISRATRSPRVRSVGWAPDLALAHQRLNPEWILQWMHNPSAIQPGTKMPSFYPGGPDDILKGNEQEQIKALRDYIFWFGTHPGQPLPGEVATTPPPPPAKAGKPLKVSSR